MDYSRWGIVMDEKKADNSIINTKVEIRHAEDDLFQSKNDLNQLEILESNFSIINKNLNQCIDLLNISVKNKRINNKIQSMCDESFVSYNKAMFNIDEERDMIVEQINEIENKIDLLNEKLKEELNKEEVNEEIEEEVEKENIEVNKSEEE